MKKFVLFISLVIAGILYAETISAQRRYVGTGNSAYGNSFGTGGGNYAKRGYRGMFEAGGGLDFCDDQGAVILSTTHGYNFNPYFFLGGGIGFYHTEYYDYYWNLHRITYYSIEYNAFRCFADARGYLLDRKVTPYIGCRIGMEVNGIEGVLAYASGSLGVRWIIKNGLGLNFSIDGETGAEYCGAILFRLGFEW
ncbi:MAG: hypothetical protein NC308_01660 [Clostridium sp.]|nr:hypothetical protein [Bacteroides sp.]MCM1197573.1 hypothetical protein [Clostridium sp.]